MRVIAHVRTDLTTKFAIPRQSNVVPELKGAIVFEPEFRSPEALRGIEQYSHIWVLWEFSENKRGTWSPTVRPPILGGNERMGVFATRSSFRPNPIGLSVVKLEGVDLYTSEGPVLHISGIDMMDRTPVFDIKPYIPKWDAKPEALGGFTEVREKELLRVMCDETLLERFTPVQRSALFGVLEQDPRPAYQKDPDRIYGFEYAGAEVKFRVQDNVLVVTSVEDSSESL